MHAYTHIVTKLFVSNRYVEHAAAEGSQGLFLQLEGLAGSYQTFTVTISLGLERTVYHKLSNGKMSYGYHL
jgi:hypothetical protein